MANAILFFCCFYANRATVSFVLFSFSNLFLNFFCVQNAAASAVIPFKTIFFFLSFHTHTQKHSIRMPGIISDLMYLKVTVCITIHTAKLNLFEFMLIFKSIDIENWMYSLLQTKKA